MSPVSRGRGGRRRAQPHRPRRRRHDTVVFEAPDITDRKSWALPAAAGSYADLDLSLLDRDDEDERRYLIEAEHPQFADALRDDRELEVRGELMSPRLHVSMHEVVTTQLWTNNPPEVWATAQRLTALGYQRHVVVHMIASLISHDLWETAQRGRPFDRADFARRLDALPEGWPPPDQAFAH